MYNPDSLVRLSRLTLVSAVLLIGSTLAQTTPGSGMPSRTTAASPSSTHSVGHFSSAANPTSTKYAARQISKQQKTIQQTAIIYDQSVSKIERVAKYNASNPIGSGFVGGPRGKTGKPANGFVEMRLISSRTMLALGEDELQMETLTLIAQALVEPQDTGSRKMWSASERQSGIVALGIFLSTLKPSVSSTADTYLMYKASDLTTLVKKLAPLKQK
jgi:hypothetical protein